jgi:hypothetical protein
MYNKLICFCLFCIAITSCSLQNEFAKQKYTNFKGKNSIANVKKDIKIDLIENHNTAIVESSQKHETIHKSYALTSAEGSEIEISKTIGNNSKKELEKRINEKFLLPDTSKNKRDRIIFDELSDKEKEDALSDFYEYSKKSGNIFGVASIFGAAAIASFFMGLGGGFSLLVAFCVIGLVGWIYSFKALKRVGKITVKAQSKSFRTKYILLSVLKYFGVAVCIISIVGILVALTVQLAT